jgi:hypothetical protein
MFSQSKIVVKKLTMRALDIVNDLVSRKKTHSILIAHDSYCSLIIVNTNRRMLELLKKPDNKYQADKLIFNEIQKVIFSKSAIKKVDVHDDNKQGQEHNIT